MNSDQIKEMLLSLEPTPAPFTVVLSGKSSKKVDGLYRPDTREIILHNKNFKNDEALIYTAIHEYAHHLHFSSSDKPTYKRAHTIAFWDLFHRLLGLAEEKGLYVNLLTKEGPLKSLGDRIKKEFVEPHGKLMMDFGQSLQEAFDLCQTYGASFQDFLDRVLGMSKVTGDTAIRVSQLSLPPTMSFEQMKEVARIKDPEVRKEIAQKAKSGFSLDMMKAAIRNSNARPESDDPEVKRKQLEKEKQRIERHINDLRQRLAALESQLLTIEVQNDV